VKMRHPAWASLISVALLTGCMGAPEEAASTTAAEESMRPAEASASQNNQAKDQLQAQTGITDRSWSLVKASGFDIPDGVSVVLRLDSSKRRVVGMGGCNRYFSGYQLDGGQLRFDRLGSSKVACQGDKGTVENAYFKALASVQGWSGDGESLRLVLSDGGTLDFTPYTGP